MLLKNGKQFQLEEKHKESLKKHFPYFPSKVVFIRFPEDGPSPAARHIRMVGSVTENGIPAEYRYYESVRTDANGQHHYEPISVPLSKRRMVDNFEMLWFLFNVSPYSKDAGNSSASPFNMFEFENLEREATERISKKSVRAKAEFFIIDSEIGMSEEKVRKVSQSYYLVTDGMTEDQVRSNLLMYLEHKAKAKGSGGIEVWQDLIERAKINEMVNIKAEIQQALDQKLISFNAKKKKFYYMDGDTATAEIPTGTVTKLVPEDSLFDLFTKREEEYENFLDVLKGRKEKAKEEKKEPAKPKSASTDK